MKSKIQRAIEEAEKRLEELLPDIEKRTQDAETNSEEEPEHLKSGVTLDELELKRLQKDQENDDISTR